MANDKITMLKLKRMLQLLAAGYSLNAICKDLHSSKRTVSKYKEAANSTNRPYSELLKMDESSLEKLLQSSPVIVNTDERKVTIDTLLEDYFSELKRPHVTIQLLWEEYISKYPDGYRYTQFKKHLIDYRKKHEYAYHNVYIPGHEWQIDFAGDKLYLTERKTGLSISVVLLCCVLPYSGYAFAIALMNATMEHFFYGLSKGLSYLGGVPEMAKSDNMKQWVKRSSRYEPSFTEAVEQWCLHYGIRPEAARVRKPRDKAPVEGLVNKLYHFVYGRIRNDKFYTLDELNNRIFELVDGFNCRDFSSKGMSRMDIFFNEEKPLLSSLPATEYRFKYVKEFKVPSLYHVQVGSEKHSYSIPYEYLNEKACVIWDMETVEIYVGNKRVAIHRRDFTKYGWTTVAEHMPPSHLAYQRSKEYNAAAIQRQAAMIGPKTKESIDIILTSRFFPQQSYRSCMGVFSLVKKYGRERVESACALLRSRCDVASLTMIRNILEKDIDLAGENTDMSFTPKNENVRGASAYNDI